MSNFDIYGTEFSHAHFIGIGGVSMSGLASILLKEGYSVSGSDMNESDTTRELQSKGATIYIGHSESNISSPDLIIYTDAISPENPEFIAGKDSGAIMVDRGTFLGQLMRRYKNSIAVSGTHGKTSTTAMLSVMLADSDLNPTILLGGYLDKLKGNLQIGSENLLITEACEYKKNLLKFNASIATVLNIEADHLDYYKDLDEIVDTFATFASSIPQEGHLVINCDDKNTSRVIEASSCKVVTFGLGVDAMYRAVDIKYNSNGSTTYTIESPNGKQYSVSLNVLGVHNVYNSLGALVSAHMTGLDMDYLVTKLGEYGGTRRRLQHKGFFDGVRVIDDYAHHPTEVKVTLSAVKALGHSRVFCIFQPHTYTRTISLLDDFAASFSDADKIIVADIYAAREADSGLVHSKDLVHALMKNGVDAMYLDSFDAIVKYVSDNAHKEDLVITMGAGDIYRVGESLVK